MATHVQCPDCGWSTDVEIPNETNPIWCQNCESIRSLVYAGTDEEITRDEMRGYHDESEDIFGRANKFGNIDILHSVDGSAVTRIDADVYPVGSSFSTRYEHPEGIVLTRDDANELGIEFE